MGERGPSETRGEKGKKKKKWVSFTPYFFIEKKRREIAVNLSAGGAARY